MIREYARGEILIGLVDKPRFTPAEVITQFRALVGPRDDPPKWTIRGEFALNKRQNSIHASDSSISTLRESRIWLR